ncbi:MAG: GNAT family N-acetyltransferase [Candidatus Neomarinimicrobiota bacterium]|nr:GNAT family N-acetyltransferase [Candidatus Neomarinimicrobiota bacterium]
MVETHFQHEPESRTKVIASSGPFQIELMEYVGTNDYLPLIQISEALVEEYGTAAKLTPNTIQTYFNKDDSLPFIARHQGDIIGYIIGVPLEILSREPWARLDINFGKTNTLYTYAFVIQKKYKGNGYAKMLKRVYLNWAKKQDHIYYITGHVKQGVSFHFTGYIRIIDRIENWQGTGKTFEYYRRELDPDRIYAPRTDPPNITRV